jgi:hypothetical protein
VASNSSTPVAGEPGGGSKPSAMARWRSRSPAGTRRVPATVRSVPSGATVRMSVGMPGPPVRSLKYSSPLVPTATASTRPSAARAASVPSRDQPRRPSPTTREAAPPAACHTPCPPVARYTMPRASTAIWVGEPSSPLTGVRRSSPRGEMVHSSGPAATSASTRTVPSAAAAMSTRLRACSRASAALPVAVVWSPPPATSPTSWPSEPSTPQPASVRPAGQQQEGDDAAQARCSIISRPLPPIA